MNSLTGTLVGGIALVTLCGGTMAHDLSRAPDKPRGAAPPETLQSIELGKELPGMKGRQLRLRRVTIAPGGAIPPHSHADRPAIAYILQGRVREHRSDRSAPVEYGAGAAIPENAAVHHWIENIGDEPVIGIVVDIPNDGTGANLSAEDILKLYGRKPHIHD